MPGKPPDDDEKANAALDAEIFAMFAAAEEELVEDGVPRPQPGEEDLEPPEDDGKLSPETVRQWSKLSGAQPATAVPAGPASKVSPSMQRFALQKKK